LLFIVQIMGGIAASALVSCMFPGPLNVETTLGGDTDVVRGLFIEMMLTAQLVFTIFMLAAEKHKGTFIAPVGIGLSLFVAELTGVYFTGGSLNPARSFGPAVVNHSFPGYHWIYWVGPVLGAIVAAGFYKFIKILEFETANPGQDSQGDAGILRPDSDGTLRTDDTLHTGDAQHVPMMPLNGAGVAEKETNGYGSGFARPSLAARTSSKPRVSSPAMGTTDEAFSGLAHGMHGVDGDRPGVPRSDSRIV